MARRSLSLSAVALGFITALPRAPLAGQPATYIAAQLQAWQKGTRHNDPLQLMQHLSRALTKQDIQAVSAWFAAQPLTAAGRRP